MSGPANPPTGPLVRISTDVVVVGGSIAGLAMALFAARRGLRVVVVDADEAAGPVKVDERAGRTPRWTTPQAAHSHAFLSRAYVILRQECPDLLAALCNHGVRTMSLPAQQTGPVPADDSLVVLLSRRTTFEAVMREAVLAHPDIDYHWGRGVQHLLLQARTPPGAVPHVAGVGLDDGTHVRATVTVDATGRRGDVHGWLTEAGVDVAEEDEDCGIAYHSRFYRLHLGSTWAALNRGYTAGASFDRYSCLVFPGDNETFSVTFGVLPEDTALSGLRKDAGFEAATAQIELVRDWVDPHRSAPISAVHSMTRMRNRIRRLSRDGRPTVTGIVPLADAAAISNPAHSRGCSLALWHAQRMADAITAHTTAQTGVDHVALATTRDEVLEATLAPWVEDSRLQDAARLSRWRPDTDVTPPEPVPGTVTNGEAYVAAQHDPVVWHAFTRLQQLLATPDEVLTDPDVVGRVRSVQARGLGLPRLAGPSHEDLADLLVQAVGAPGRRRRVGAGTGA